MRYVLLSLLFFCTLVLPLGFAEAASTPLVYSGWLPYWKKASSTPDVMAHLGQLGEISPFSYEVRANGTIYDPLKIDQAPWPELFRAAKAKKVAIIPTVAWFDGKAIHTILSDATTRKKHLDALIAIAIKPQFAGIDIDYENKKAETRTAFSTFIKELSTRLHANKKVLSCTIEPRTPLDARFVIPPSEIEYVNDYAVLNKYCDQIRIMAYDQTTIDIKLNARKSDKAYYAPVADVEWVKKVIELAIKTIDRKKVMIGVPTYGYEYEVKPKGSGYEYKRLRSLTYQTALELAAANKTIARRNSADELSFTYQSGTSTRLVWFSDAVAVADKVAWAKIYGLRGVALFRFDVANDPKIWERLK